MYLQSRLVADIIFYGIVRHIIYLIYLYEIPTKVFV